MLWKVAARTYVKKRLEFLEMGPAQFGEYFVTWKPRALKALNDAGRDSHRDAQWEGFNDALNDVQALYAQPHEPDPVALEWERTCDRLLDYLYEETEG